MTDGEKRVFFHEAGHYVIGKLLGINVTGIKITRNIQKTEASVAYNESAVGNKIESMPDEELDSYFIKHCKKDIAGAIAGFYSTNKDLPDYITIFNEFKSKAYNKSDYDKFMINIEDIEKNLEIKHDPLEITKETIELVKENKEKIFKLFELIERKYDENISSFSISKDEIEESVQI